MIKVINLGEIVIDSEIEEHNGTWRLGRDGYWHKYIGSQWRYGKCAKPELQKILNAIRDVAQIMEI